MDYIDNPMDFDQMLTKLDNGEYHCAQDFLDDIDLIADNALKYNSDLEYETNKIICHRARALQDFAYALVKAEMDTDFEDNCKEIVKRREKLTEKLKKPQESVSFDPKTNQIVKTNAQGQGMTSPKPRKKKTRKSRWSSGILTPKPRKRKDSTNEEETQDSNPDDHQESDSDHEVTLNDSKDLQVLLIPVGCKKIELKARKSNYFDVICKSEKEHDIQKGTATVDH